jgi:hypothetical protein
MSLPPRSPSAHDRAIRARMGVSASGLMLTLLLANQSAARDAPEPLPYLLQSSPQALRFATARVPTAPPPKPGERDAMDAHAGADASSPSASGPGDQSRKDDPTAAGETVLAGEVNDAAAPPATSPSAPEPAAGLPILPDGYAPQTAVSVEDLLPYFSAPPKSASRASYEVK